MTTISISQDDDIKRAIAESLEPLNIEDIVKNKVVAIKPNDTWASKEDTTAVTQGDSLRAVIQYIKKFMPARIIVSGGAGAAETEDVFRYSGMMEALLEEEAVFFDHNKPPFKDVNLQFRSEQDIQVPQKEIKINPHIMDYEVLVALNQLKVHSSATVTLAMKNIAMSFPPADYYGHPRESYKHEHDFFSDLHLFIVSMIKRFPIDLSITVGHPAMVGSGPVGGHTFETGLAVSSRDAIACDAACAEILGFKAEDVKHIKVAGELGLGETDKNKFEYPGMSLKEAADGFRKIAKEKGFLT